MKLFTTLMILVIANAAMAMSQQLIRIQVEQSKIHQDFELKSDRKNSIGFSATNGYFDAIYSGRQDGKWVLALQKNKDRFFFQLPDDPNNFNNRVIYAPAAQTGQKIGLQRTIDHYYVGPAYTDITRQSCNYCRQVCRPTRGGNRCYQECYQGWQETRVVKRDHDFDGNVQLVAANGTAAAEVTFRDRLVEILNEYTSGCY